MTSEQTPHSATMDLSSLGIGEFPAAMLLPDSCTLYNAWVLDPESADPDTVRASLPTDLTGMVDVVAFTVGLTDQIPEPTPDQRAEVAAMMLSARATGLVEEAQAPAAIELLTRASSLVETVSVGLAGILLGTAGTLNPDPVAARVDLDRALGLLAGAGADPEIARARAELHHALGGIAHAEALEVGMDTREAMGHYYAGLQLVSEASAPLTWAGLQLDLAAAQLATGMKQASDQLRLGVAAQALRACRRVFTPDQHRGPWSMATLNLANALVYLPSTHQGDNLVEAVELYEEVLNSGAREDDAAAKARVLANQGNALAHLGIFDQARSKLAEARFLFETVLDHDGALMVRQVLDEIAKATTGFDPDAEEADLHRQTDQMARMPQEATGAGYTAGMGVTRIPSEAQNRAKVTVLGPQEASS